MSIYPRLQNSASRLLSKFSQGVVQLVKVDIVSSPMNEWDEPQVVETAYTLDAVCEGVNQKYIDGQVVLATDLQITAAVFEESPLVGDKLYIDGNPLTIVKVLANPSAGIVCNWVLFAR